MKFTCACCGYQTLNDWPGSYEICKVCFWEDDPVQLLDPGYTGGANPPSLMMCQENFAKTGVSEDRFKGNVRPPRAKEKRDPEWRPANESDLLYARAPKDITRKEHQDLNVWYYWKRKTGSSSSDPI